MKTIYKREGTISEAALSPGLQLAIVPDESTTETQIQRQYGKQRGSEEKGCRKGSDLTECPITLDGVLLP
jgi:hypothetical protein